MKLRAEFTAEIKAARDALNTIADGRRFAVEWIATRLRENIDDAYLAKSRGQTGSDGITWKPRQDGLLPIGIKSGYLRSTLKVTVDHDSQRDRITATYKHPFAPAFGAIRPLLPEKLPLAWRRDAAQPITALANQAATHFV